MIIPNPLRSYQLELKVPTNNGQTLIGAELAVHVTISGENMENLVSGSQPSSLSSTIRRPTSRPSSP